MVKATLQSWRTPLQKMVRSHELGLELYWQASFYERSEAFADWCSPFNKNWRVVGRTLKRISANCSTTMSSINRLYPTEFVYASIFLKGQKGAESGMTEQAPTVPRQRHRPPDATENNNAHHGAAAETSPTYSSFKEPADSKEVLWQGTPNWERLQPSNSQLDVLCAVEYLTPKET